jgi:hypothetical protein
MIPRCLLRVGSFLNDDPMLDPALMASQNGKWRPLLTLLTVPAWKPAVGRVMVLGLKP